MSTSAVLESYGLASCVSIRMPGHRWLRLPGRVRSAHVFRPAGPSVHPVGEAVLKGPCGARTSSKWSSFGHQNQFQPTHIDRVQLEGEDRSVPCKHKGIRQFSEIFGATRVKARTLQGVAGSKPVSPTKGPFAKLLTKPATKSQKIAPEDSQERFLVSGVSQCRFDFNAGLGERSVWAVERFVARRSVSEAGLCPLGQ
jgi:hypothetical protein